MQEDLVDKALNTSNKEEISILSKNNDSEVRQSIACNENTSRNIFHRPKLCFITNLELRKTEKGCPIMEQPFIF